jgi:hypothetical protein
MHMRLCRVGPTPTPTLQSITPCPLSWHASVGGRPKIHTRLCHVGPTLTPTPTLRSITTLPSLFKLCPPC